MPAFFQWLNTRLSSVRVLNVECRVLTSPRARRRRARCRWAWPSGASLVPPPSTDGAARLCATRLVVLPAADDHQCINVQPWLGSVARNCQQLTALCLKGFSVRALPVMPQLEVLVYGCISHRLTPGLLDSVARQPRLVSLQLIGKWPEGVVCGSVLRLEDMTRLMCLRLDVAELMSIQHMPALERCTVAVTLLNPDTSCNAQGREYTAWALNAFTALSSLSIEWDDSHVHRVLIDEVLDAVPKSVRSVDITFPKGCSMYLPHLDLSDRQTLVALRLRISGLTGSQNRLAIDLHASMQRLTVQLWGGRVFVNGPDDALQSMTDMHVEAASIEAWGLGFWDLYEQERWQCSARVPHKTEIYGGTGRRGVQVVHMGAWPPSFPGYEGPDVPEARACCYWPCACGACESCRRADFWPVALG